MKPRTADRLDLATILPIGMMLWATVARWGNR